MKKTIIILSALLLGLVSCSRTEFETVEPATKAEQSGLVAITMQLKIPAVELKAATKANGFSHNPQIDDIRVAVFGTSGYPQAYSLAEPVDASGNPLSDYATTNGDTYYFKVLLPVYEGEAHVHIIANGDESIKFVDQDEDSIMSAMKTENNVGAFWARVIMPDGILTQLDDNGIMQTDDEGNFIPSEDTAHLFEDLVLVRNFAEVSLLNESEDISDISWTLVNKPTFGSVAPMVSGTYVDDFKDYVYDAETGKMVKGSDVYDGFMFADDPMDYTIPDASAISTPLDQSNFLYERTHPGSAKATCILMKAKFRTDSYYTYYRMDLTEESLGGYFPIYRNYKYQVKIHKVGNRGAKTPAEAMNRDSGGNVSQSTEAKTLTDISDGVSRLYVEYVEKNFTSGGKKTIWVQYVPDVTTGVVDNTKLSIRVKDQGTALVESSVPTKTASSSDTGYYFYEFELNEQDESNDLVSVLEIKADNEGDGTDLEESRLYRDITLRVMKKMDMELALRPKKVAGQGSTTILDITLPSGLPSSMFPLELLIEDVNHALAPTGEDGNGNAITVPVKTDKSLADGTTNSYYYVRTVNESEYLANPVVTTQFKTNKESSATTIYVANEYFKTQTINLLNDGIYVNPTNASVAFNVTSVEVEIESDDQTKTWTVSAGNGVTVNVTSGTGNGSFTMTFPVNNSVTSAVTRTATVTSDGVSHTVTITQRPLEFSITPASQTILFNKTTAIVTVHAEEGKAWTASVSNGATLSATSGEGTASITMTIPANSATTQRTYTVTATMTDPSATATATIIQTRAPASPYTFSYTAFSFTGGGGSSEASSPEGFVTVSFANSSRGNGNNNNYVRMSNNNAYGTLTIAPASGIRVTQVVVTYANNYADSNPTVSAGSRSLSGNTLTWNVTSTSPVTLTASVNGNYNGRRVTSVQVTYEAI